MGKINSIKLSREELDNGYIPANHVMVESDMTVYGKKTKGGILYGFDEDVQFEGDNNSWEADVADVSGVVYDVPLKLYYNKEDQHNSMSWLTDMEVIGGDTVWFSPIESRNATALECEGKYYKLIPYADLIVAKRKRWISKMAGTFTTDVICLNGRILIEPVYKTNTSDLAISKKGDIDPTKGIVRFLGKPNQEYLVDSYYDFQYLSEGDLVMLQVGTPLVPLERRTFNARFDNGKMYNVVQRRKIALILSRGH